jgi:UDP-N-acetylmuramoylalanine--D-glutamate ligase
MQEAVSCAAALASPGQTVLLAPGTSSFDMFSGYEARGNAFCAAVKNLTKPTTSNE